MLQVPWFEGMAEASHGSVVWSCTRATGGDILILLAGFWLASMVRGNRQWVLLGERKPAAMLVVTALLVTIVLERLATGPLERWTYADAMPIVPLLQVGMSPLLQWLLVPPLLLWLTRRHLVGQAALRSYNPD